MPEPTFLFTDIEGSTRLWEAHPLAMRSALVGHDELLQRVITVGGGEVFKHTGDGMIAVFDSVGHAVPAAVAAQRELVGSNWGEVGPLRVRMAVHRGPAEERGGDYFGPALNRAARLLEAGHGGQLLVSEEAAASAGWEAGADLRDLGEHRLRDLGRAGRVYQVLAEGLEAEFPPLRTLASFPNNLPLQLATFVGRDRELDEVRGMLAENRLLTLTGVGGVGKSRLAIQVAAASVERFPDGVWLVELAPVVDPANLPSRVAAALRVRSEQHRDIEATLRDHLSGHDLLLILDNCEHVIDAAAKFADAFLRSCPGLTIVATSREGLGLSGEALWIVPSLSLPEEEAAPGRWRESEAVRLFLERAELVRPGFAPDDGELAAIADICRRLDGIPLAIELAVGRLRVLSVQQVAARLDDRFRLLTGGSRTALPRQRTLQATMDWSYDLLPRHEQVLLRRLAVFQSGFTLEAAEEVCSGDELPRFEILDLLAHLVQTSLVTVDEGTAVRYGMLETVRQYGLDRLIEAGEADEARRRHACFYRDLAFARRHELIGRNQREWAQRFRSEHQNFRVALNWALDAGEVEIAMGLTAWLDRFWWQEGHNMEARRWQHAVLAVAPDEPSAELAQILGDASLGAAFEGDVAEAEAFAKREAEVSAAIGDEAVMVRSMQTNATVARLQGNIRRALELLEAGVDRLRKTDSPHLVVMLANVAFTAVNMGLLDRAEQVASELSERDDPFARVIVHAIRGYVDYYGSQLDEAQQHLAEARRAGELLSHKPMHADITIALAWVALYRREAAAAMAHGAAAVQEAVDLEDPFGEAEGLLIQAAARNVDGDLSGALDLLRAAIEAALRLDVDIITGLAMLVGSPILVATGRHRDAALIAGAIAAYEAGTDWAIPGPMAADLAASSATVDEALGSGAFAAARVEGSTLSPYAAVEHIAKVIEG